ncbi:ABC transporter substrate-binding protein [Sodalis glossinidius]|uniref:ABC transporter substrate-binding protein n=1 Tax=Sodalis glossinidius TaxID=63612 RepID=UPI000322A010|nr:ABC transporter substrate-binding protein [Sodalis glossinidius]
MKPTRWILLPNSLSRIRIIAAKYKDAPSSDFNNGKAAIGTGPFVLVEYVPGNKVVLKRNEHYWGEAFPYEQVERWLFPTRQPAWRHCYPAVSI